MSNYTRYMLQNYFVRITLMSGETQMMVGK